MHVIKEDIRKIIAVNEQIQSKFKSIAATQDYLDLFQENSEIEDLLFDQECMLEDLTEILKSESIRPSDFIGINTQPIKGTRESLELFYQMACVSSDETVRLLKKQRELLYEALQEMPPVKDFNQIEIWPVINFKSSIKKQS